MRRVLLLMVFALVIAACGASGSADTEADLATDETASSTTTTSGELPAEATTTAAPTSTPSTTQAPTTTIAPVVDNPDCPDLEAILGLLWNNSVNGGAADPAFAAFDPGKPVGTMTVTAFAEADNLLAAIWEFPEPPGDGLARGIVWADGEIVGDVYYLDGVDPIVEGDADLLRRDTFLTLELATGDDNIANAVCWAGPKPALIPIDTPLSIYGLGPVQPGMTLAEVVAAVPDFDVEPYGFADFGGACFHVPIGDTGVVLQLEGSGPDSSPLDGIVRVVSVAWSYKTPSGLGFGSTKEEVEAALGDQLEISAHAYVEGFYLDFVPNDPAEQDLRLRFVITSDIVTEMRAGFAGWTSLVEGCA